MTYRKTDNREKEEEETIGPAEETREFRCFPQRCSADLVYNVPHVRCPSVQQPTKTAATEMRRPRRLTCPGIATR